MIISNVSYIGCRLNCKGESVGNSYPSVESLLFQCQTSPEKLGLYNILNIPDSCFKQTRHNENEVSQPFLQLRTNLFTFHYSTQIRCEELLRNFGIY